MTPISISGWSLHRVVEASRLPGDHRSVRLAVLDEVRRVVPFDAYAWLLTDPETEVGSAPLADVPCLSELPRLIRLKYLTETNRWTHLVPRAASLRSVTAGACETSLVWREILRDHGVIDVASIVFRDRHGCWGFLDLWRVDPQPPFSATELRFLAGLAEPVTEALRKAAAQSFDDVADPPIRSGPIVLVLAPDLRVRAQTPETDAYLRRLVPPSSDQLPIPAGAYNVAAQLLACEAGIDDHPPSARVHLADGTWLTLRASRITNGGPIDQQDIAVSIEPTSPSERLSLFARACALTPRESELLLHIADGADTHRIADLMYLSELTVQDHFKSIFRKTGTHNRRTLLARAIGR